MKNLTIVLAAFAAMLFVSAEASAQTFQSYSQSTRVVVGGNNGYGTYRVHDSYRHRGGSDVSIGVHIGNGGIGIHIGSNRDRGYRHQPRYPQHPQYPNGNCGQRYNACGQQGFYATVIEYVQVRVPVTCMDRCGRVVYTGQYRYETRPVERQVYVWYDGSRGCYLYRDGQGRVLQYAGRR